MTLRFARAQYLDAVPSQIAHTQLWMPPTSDRMAITEEIYVSSSRFTIGGHDGAAMGSGVEFFDALPLSTFAEARGLSVERGIPSSAEQYSRAELHYQSTSVAGQRLIGQWVNRFGPQIIRHPFIIKPGHGLVIRSGGVGEQMVADFLWREEPAPPPPPGSGSQAFSTPGTFPFTVPNYATALVLEMYGAGAGSFGDGNGTTGGDGGSTTFDATLVAAGGNANGTPGSATGGDINTSGSPGQPGASGSSGAGGKAGGPSGGLGGQARTTDSVGQPGSAPGGGASGGYGGSGAGGQGGGGAAYLKKTFAVGQLTPGSVVQIIVGQGGPAGGGNRVGAVGAHGRAILAWT